MRLTLVFWAIVALATLNTAIALPVTTPISAPTRLALIAGAQLFHGVGVVTGVDENTGVVTIDHKAIPGLMDAMEMDYNASPKSLLHGLKTGDRVEFDVDGKEYKIHAIKKTRL